MNSALVHLTRGRSVARIAIVILTARHLRHRARDRLPKRSRWGGGRFAAAAEGDITRAAAGARITSAVTDLAAET